MNQLSFGILTQAYNGGIYVDWWKSEGPTFLKAVSLNGTSVYDAVLDSLTGFVGKLLTQKIIDVYVPHLSYTCHAS